jgi:nanoRNase/pAp phosphatase (c-di-AMP/oligoRNAs hydrolase)
MMGIFSLIVVITFFNAKAEAIQSGSGKSCINIFIASALALKKVITTIKENIPIMLYGHGISHPQNRTMVRILNINISDPTEEEIVVEGDNIVNICVDFNPASTNFSFTPIQMDWCIDHHLDKNPPPLTKAKNGIACELGNCDIRPVGACSTILWDYLRTFNVKLEDESIEDDNLVVALVLGIKTDTHDLLGEETTEEDDEAYKELRKLCDVEKLHEILQYKLPPYYYDYIELSCQNKQVVDPVIVINLGFIEEDKRDIISQVADFWLSRRGTENVVVFGIMTESNDLVASGRVGKSNIKASDLIRGIFKSGGGHPDKAACRVDLFWMDLKYLTEKSDREKLLDILTALVLKKTCYLTETK